MKELLKGLNIYLIGMMGSGKTTVGELLAKELGYRFLDTDTIISAVSEKSINQIFAEDGEDEFRQLESDVLQEVSAYLYTVIATGGGIILRQQNWSHLRDGMVVWLNVPINVLVQRLKDDDTRPLLKREELQTKLTSLYEQRKSLYQQADITIGIEENDNPNDIVQKIMVEIPHKIRQENRDLN
ncbi:shikimate kinase [Cyanobacterium aponinum AL20118]|uniref:Shikimate kinase n=1 Tax=Cyanobacterium aponinum AL20115 TaxID=3090662 RepID=A0AAF0ZG32_9CHRO|nr:shikimate kinase [Cyanobacterium aponinum]WPF89555.1 shikimate kinase [Cyanobacterium aponinum AL20115]